MSARGRDNGPPGLRPQCHPSYYGAHYSDAEIAELTLMCGLFNMWNRFTGALHIELEPAEERALTACLARTKPIQPSIR